MTVRMRRFRPRRSSMKPPLVAHRYLPDGSIEIICRNCLDVVCNVRAQEDASPILDKHVCESADLPNPRLPERSASYASSPPKGTEHWMSAFLHRNQGAA